MFFNLEIVFTLFQINKISYYHSIPVFIFRQENVLYNHLEGNNLSPKLKRRLHSIPVFIFRLYNHLEGNSPSPKPIKPQNTTSCQRHQSSISSQKVQHLRTSQSLKYILLLPILKHILLQSILRY